MGAALAEFPRNVLRPLQEGSRSLPEILGAFLGVPYGEFKGDGHALRPLASMALDRLAASSHRPSSYVLRDFL